MILNLKYIFFILKEKNIYYSEEMGQEIIEYIAIGWDILYPIKRELTDFFVSSKYIVEGDLRKEKSY